MWQRPQSFHRRPEPFRSATWRSRSPPSSAPSAPDEGSRGRLSSCQARLLPVPPPRNLWNDTIRKIIIADRDPDLPGGRNYYRGNFGEGRRFFGQISPKSGCKIQSAASFAVGFIMLIGGNSCRWQIEDIGEVGFNGFCVLRKRCAITRVICHSKRWIFVPFFYFIFLIVWVVWILMFRSRYIASVDVCVFSKIGQYGNVFGLWIKNEFLLRHFLENICRDWRLKKLFIWQILLKPLVIFS